LLLKLAQFGEQPAAGWAGDDEGVCWQSVDSNATEAFCASCSQDLFPCHGRLFDFFLVAIAPVCSQFSRKRGNTQFIHQLLVAFSLSSCRLIQQANGMEKLGELLL
jgi:hypothetical protein